MSPRVLVIEDDPRFASIVQMLLEAAGFEVTIAPGGRVARAEVRRAAPDAVVLDLGLPDCDGVELARELSAAGLPVLVLSGARASQTVIDAVRAGASGYLFKEDLARRLIAGVEELLTGGTPLSGPAARALVERVRDGDEARDRASIGLTARELDVLRELARGLTYEQVALVLDVSLNTVRAHVRAIYEKLHASSRTEAVLAGIRLGLVDEL